ncbi:MAG: endonuclease VII domain-containing protein, partial [Thaumarchaeota archaeon]|nr:endonuclease VII domain-containing protein [Nitrososphaerota archaeon]
QRRRLYYEKNKEKVLTRSREWASANVDKRKRIARTYQVGLYGLTVEQYEVMHRRQEGKCLICDQQKVLVVDHNHQTNEVRGLLCGSCNRGIGLLKDDIMNLTKAIAYLERTPPQ